MIIDDKPPQLEQIIKKVKKNIFNLALGNRNSHGSVKSNNTFNSQQGGHEYHTHTNTTHPVPVTSSNKNVSNSQPPAD